MWWVSTKDTRERGCTPLILGSEIYLNYGSVDRNSDSGLAMKNQDKSLPPRLSLFLSPTKYTYRFVVTTGI